jgi:serine/tyrosine/threonine adenylyltransferase
MGQKIGIHAVTSEDYPLIDRLLELMQTYQADYTNTFLSLQQIFASPSWFLEDDVKEWNSLWLKRISKEQDPYSLMKQVNPTVIPRNHLVESALSKAQKGDMTLFHSLLKALQQPFSIPSEDFQSPGPIDERFVTYCGT